MFKYVGSWLIYMVLLQISSEGRITFIKAHFHGVHQHNMYFTLNSYYLNYKKITYNKQIARETKAQAQTHNQVTKSIFSPSATAHPAILSVTKEEGILQRVAAIVT